LQYPHHDRLLQAVAAKRMDARGFVSKKARLEKADRKKDAPWLMKKGSIVRLQQSGCDVKSRKAKENPANLTCSSLYWEVIAIIPGRGHDLGKILRDLLGPGRKPSKTTLDRPLELR
jgi:hypothetical protein